MDLAISFLAKVGQVMAHAIEDHERRSHHLADWQPLPAGRGSNVVAVHCRDCLQRLEHAAGGLMLADR